jgi:hypothetical protein
MDQPEETAGKISTFDDSRQRMPRAVAIEQRTVGMNDIYGLTERFRQFLEAPYRVPRHRGHFMFAR